jgi:hypothetical protein
MKKTMNQAYAFFLVLTLLTVTIGIAKESILGSTEVKVPVKSESVSGNLPQLPDEDSTYMNALLSALGGFGGGGLLLVFLLRRLVVSYDNTFAKWETRWDSHSVRDDKTNDKIISMIDTVQETAQELKMEIIKLQANAVDKNTVIEALTKVAILETDVEKMRGEVSSIMTHLINKPRASGLTIRS